MSYSPVSSSSRGSSSSVVWSKLDLLYCVPYGRRREVFERAPLRGRCCRLRCPLNSRFLDVLSDGLLALDKKVSMLSRWWYERKREAACSRRRLGARCPRLSAVRPRPPPRANTPAPASLNFAGLAHLATIMSSKTFLRQITRRVGNAREHISSKPRPGLTFRGGAPCRHYWTNTTGLPPPRVNLRDLRANTESKAHNARIRKAPLPENAIQTIVSLSSEQTALTKELHATQHEQSLATEQIKQNAKNRGALPEIMAKAKELKAKIKQLEAQLADVVDRLQVLALRVPNDTHPDVPIGPELAARVLSQHGPPPVEATPQRDHVAVGRQLGLFDFEAAATVTGTSWYYLLNEGALLEMALTNYALSVAARRGWRPVTAPDVVRADIAYRCGFQPRDPDGQEASQTYHVSYLPADAKAGAEAARHPELVLAGTAEIPLAGMFAKRDLERSELPAKVIGLGRAFRAEAGARGADTRGLYRVHQFTKLELFAVTEEGQSDAMMEELKSLQTELFEGLGLTFR